MPERTLRVCALYPDLMNIYADRGNLLLLERRCRWRGIGFELQRRAGSATSSIPTAPTCTTSAAARTATSGCARSTSPRSSAMRSTRPPPAAR